MGPANTPPPNARFPLGAKANSTLAKSFSAATSLPLTSIDHHTAPRLSGWKVRDQGQRGTCVAHALAACTEVLAFQSVPPVPTFDGSEQFLFWGAKQFDPSATDGTTHPYTLQALQNHGLCDEATWPYNPLPLATVDQGPPPGTAVLAASNKRHVGGSVTAPGNATLLYAALCQAPVAIGVPVFADPVLPTNDNWNAGGLMEFGRVLDPQPSSVVIGGHAVCIVGFEPDPTEPAGRGWFIIRNSWGVSPWGSKLPAAGAYWGPEPGYGQISWSYVDLYLWEMCSL
ncbi:C1 family peptidase [Rugamonas rubra]|uniref:C1 family peptidase n=1 Tax=Rugamonas rubra TaxID=758825 RepID=UPI003CCC08CF